MCAPNLRINGRSFEELNADEQSTPSLPPSPLPSSLSPALETDAPRTDGIEPFDEGLDRHIWALADQRLQWDGEIARKRREKPAEVHRLLRELLATQRAADEQEAAEYAALALDAGADADDGACPFVLWWCGGVGG